MYIGADELIADLHNEGQTQELSVQKLRDEESTLGSVPPSVWSRGSDLSSDDNSASSSELSEFTVSGSITTVNATELTDISIKELEVGIVSYKNEEHEVNIDSPVDFVRLLDCYPEQSSILAGEKLKNEAAAIKDWGSKFSHIFF